MCMNKRWRCNCTLKDISMCNGKLMKNTKFLWYYTAIQSHEYPNKIHSGQNLWLTMTNNRFACMLDECFSS